MHKSWNETVRKIRADPVLYATMLQSVMSSMRLAGFEIDQGRSERIFEQALSGPPLVCPGHEEEPV